jgi:hypothetical protein
VQGFQNFDAGTVMASIYGQNSILSGVFPLTSGSADGTIAMTDGLLVSTAQTALIGGGGPWMIHNYKRPQSGANPAAGTRDPFVAYLDTATSPVAGTSVLEFHEQTDLINGTYRIAGIRQLGTDMGLYFGEEAVDEFGQLYISGHFAFKAYDFRSPETYVPIACSQIFTVSSQEQKTDVTPIGEHLDILEVIDAVDPVRFRYANASGGDGESRTLWVPDLTPDEPADPDALHVDLVAAREQKTDEGLIPVDAGPAPSRGSRHTYGVIAEEIAAVAPDAVVTGSTGLMLNQGSMNGLLWAAVKALSEKVAALEASGS